MFLLGRTYIDYCVGFFFFPRHFQLQVNYLFRTSIFFFSVDQHLSFFLILLGSFSSINLVLYILSFFDSCGSEKSGKRVYMNATGFVITDEWPFVRGRICYRFDLWVWCFFCFVLTVVGKKIFSEKWFYTSLFRKFELSTKLQSAIMSSEFGKRLNFDCIYYHMICIR